MPIPLLGILVDRIGDQRRRLVIRVLELKGHRPRGIEAALNLRSMRAPFGMRPAVATPEVRVSACPCAENPDTAIAPCATA